MHAASFDRVVIKDCKGTIGIPKKDPHLSCFLEVTVLATKCCIVQIISEEHCPMALCG